MAKKQITIMIDEELLRQIDSTGTSRSGVINGIIAEHYADGKTLDLKGHIIALINAYNKANPYNTIGKKKSKPAEE